jgi:hypothetical protein
MSAPVRLVWSAPESIVLPLACGCVKYSIRVADIIEVSRVDRLLDLLKYPNLIGAVTDLQNTIIIKTNRNKNYVVSIENLDGFLTNLKKLNDNVLININFIPVD